MKSCATSQFGPFRFFCFWVKNPQNNKNEYTPPLQKNDETTLSKTDLFGHMCVFITAVPVDSKKPLVYWEKKVKPVF